MWGLEMLGLFSPTAVQKSRQSSETVQKGTALLSRQQREKVHCPEYGRAALKSGFQEVISATHRKVPFSIY